MNLWREVIPIWLVATAAVIGVIVSANLLSAAGSAYTSEGGSMVEKIHPANYLIYAAFVSVTISNLMQRRASTFWRDDDWSIFAGGMGICALYTCASSGSGNLIALLDTFIPAGLAAVILSNATSSTRDILRRAIAFALLLNACLALAESATGARLVPIPEPLVNNEREFRPTALYDHPLTGAATTAIGLYLVPAVKQHPIAATIYIGLLASGMLAFGGRIAILVIGALILVVYTRVILKQLLADRQLSLRVLTSLLAGCLALTCGGALLADGIGTRLREHAYWDASAQVRIDQFHVLDYLTWPQLLFGCRRADLLSIYEPLRLSYGVGVLENFWLLMFVCLGALCFPAFLLGMFGLLRFLWRRTTSAGRLMIVATMLIASASNSLGRKSTLLVTVTACALCCREPGQSTTRTAFAPLNPAVRDP